MSEEQTKRLGDNSLTFEARVLAELGSISSRLAALEKREAERQMETKPGLDQIISEVRSINTNVQTYLKNFERKLDVVNSELLQMKADHRSLEDRLTKVEIETRPQLIPQERQF